MANNNLTLALKIKADLNNALNNFKSLEKELQRTSKAGAQTGKQAQAGAAGLNALGKSADQTTGKLGKTRAGVESISKQLAVMKSQLLGLTGLSLAGLGLKDIADTADQYTNYQARIKLVSRSNQEAQGTFRALMDVANDTGQLFSATAELYTRVYRSLGNSANSAEILQFTKTIQQAVVISGASAQEASAALIQLSQGLASGTLRGEEFNSVSEQMPILLDILQKSLGKTRGELRKMAEDGQLTPQIILQATKEAQEEIARQYEQMPKTIGRAINELSNAWLQFIGQTDNTISASSVIASTISLLAQNLNLVGSALLILGGIMAGRFVGQLKLAQSAFKSLSGFLTVMNKQGIAAAASLVSIGQAGALAGRGLSALFGGPVGIAISATLGLISVYQSLKAEEEKLEAQFNQTALTLDSNIAKTEGLIEARTKLGELGGFSDRVSQVETNNKTLEEAKAKLEELIEVRDKLQEQMLTDSVGGFLNLEKLEEANKRVKEMEESVRKLQDGTDALAKSNQEQLTAAFNSVIEAGGELAEKLKAIGDPTAPEAMELLEKVIKDAEGQMTSMGGELDKIESKIRQELANSTMTATEQLEAMKAKFLELGRTAGASAGMMDGFISRINTIIDLQKQLDFAKQEKEGDKFIESLQRRLTTKTKGTAAGLKEEARRKGLTGDKLAKADSLAEQIEAAEKAKKSGSSKNKYNADSKNLELNIQYLRLTGQEVKANLTDIEGRYNKLLAEFQKHSNVDGINLIKKILPLEQVKVQIDGVQAEINRLFQNQSAQEQRIQSQVNTGLISHLEGQRQLKEVYAQTVAEIEKQLPLLEKLAQMPGAQGEQARNMLEQMNLKVVELKTAGNDLEKAFKDGLTQGIQSSLMGLAQGTMTLKDAIKNLALTIVNSMAQIAAQQLAMQATSAISGIFGAVGGTVTAATGGYIRGPGTSTSDSIPARLSDGEYVVKAASVAHYGVGFLHAINRRQLRSFSQGGPVSVPPIPSHRELGLSDSLREGRGGSQAVASPVHIQQTLAVDSAELFTAGINTHAGEQAVLTVIRANKQTLKEELK
ncbi:tape measure protein [Pasteurella multocida]|uniref:tape measure protein n=1 Tax=Pasteurella multocida TaxID=747 RepID=UPI0039799FCA